MVNILLFFIPTLVPLIFKSSLVLLDLRLYFLVGISSGISLHLLICTLIIFSRPVSIVLTVALHSVILITSYVPLYGRCNLGDFHFLL
jgi:hypothetical protein